MDARTPQTGESTEPILLSPVDDLFWRFGERFGGARVVLVVRLDGCVEAELLAIALGKLQRRHPKLRTMIGPGSDGRNRYHFHPAPPPIPFEIADHDEGEPPWREETRRLLQIGFPAAGPLAGVTVLRSRARNRCDLLLTIHHAIADGRSTIMLLDDLLTEYADAEAHLDRPPDPVLPAVTAVRAKSSGSWSSRWWMLRRMVRLQIEDKRWRITPLPEARDIPSQSQWVHWVYSREDTLRLVRRCRKEGASFGSAQLAAVCCGLMDCLPVSKALFKCHFPFDLRDELVGSPRPISAEDLGCFVSTMNEYYEVRQRPAFWDLARRAHRDLQEFVEQGGPSLYYNLAQAGANRVGARATPMVLSPTSRRTTLFSTNYGVVNVRDAYGSLRPQECTLIFKNDVIGPSLVMEALVMGQRLNVGLCAEGLDPAFWEGLHVAVRRRLDAAITGEPAPSWAESPVNADQDVSPQRTRVAPQE